MAFIGNTSTTQSFVAAIDYFSGNASTTAFTLSRPVASVAQVQAVIENVPQSPGSAFTVSGNTITFTSAPPTGTNNIYVYYTSPITQVIQPSQGTVGAAQLDIASFNGTGSMGVPVGTTAQRPASPSTGYMRFNSSSKTAEIYTGTGWEVIGDQSSTYAVDFVVVAGGGGGGGASTGSIRSGGGGGAGGFRTSAGTSGGGGAAESSLTVTAGTTYTITVGAGGAGAGAGLVGRSVSGNNSVFAPITATGGGAGGDSGYSPLSGGSGGGGGSSAGVTSGASGTTGQGYAGGTGDSSSTYRAAGGGGAGAAGTNPNGGNGVATSISGSSVTYAGGGGAGGNNLPASAGSGGTGGGGAGGSSGAGAAGTANTGGGGGGAYAPTNSAGGNGGSGIVVLRMLTTKYSGTTTGSPAVTTSGLYTILTYTSSGTYTA